MSLTGIGEVATAVTSIVNKIWPDATQAQKDALQREMTQLQMQQAMAPHASKIMGDIPNYTDQKPVIQISEVVQG